MTLFGGHRTSDSKVHAELPLHLAALMIVSTLARLNTSNPVLEPYATLAKSETLQEIER